ncbi:hypothetical protein NQ318_000492 [Aromia moschata]|uniref:PiggyBac transposable element-derived protein domain-containing protein n=1 Tax=Aromia moschata TaxID=1265417 RepID=A0AAV8YFH2_9CUCU|nr:hypothetical protein NQ318_000492 [Aromia moschata]
MARNKRCTEAELLDILMNSDEDEAFLVQEKEGDGWDVLPEDSGSGISFEETPIFSQVMSRDRYFQILRFLHFCDNDNIDKNDRLYKIRCVVDHFKNSFKNSLYPFQNLVIDESLMLFKGRISFCQYIPSKRHRFRIKFFVLVDCETGYILDYIIYTGSITEIGEIDEKFGKSGNIVLTLTEKYWGKGHRLYTDNWYTSPLLFQFLFENKMNCCGTVKANRKFMPPFDKKKAARGKYSIFPSMPYWQLNGQINVMS